MISGMVRQLPFGLARMPVVRPFRAVLGQWQALGTTRRRHQHPHRYVAGLEGTCCRGAGWNYSAKSNFTSVRS